MRRMRTILCPGWPSQLDTPRDCWRISPPHDQPGRPQASELPDLGVEENAGRVVQTAAIALPFASPRKISFRAELFLRFRRNVLRDSEDETIAKAHQVASAWFLLSGFGGLAHQGPHQE